MKRIVICLVMLAGLISVSMYSACKVNRVEAEIVRRINEISATLEQDDRNRLFIQVTELNDYWLSEESTLVHYIRHSHIDSITISMARLPQLAKYGDLAEASAELSGILSQTRHIREAEALTLENLF